MFSFSMNKFKKIKMQNTVSDCFTAVTCRNDKHAQTLTSRILKLVATSLDFVQMEILFTVCLFEVERSAAVHTFMTQSREKR